MSGRYRSAVRGGIERLEERAVLTAANATVSIVSNGLVIQGDNGADHVFVLQLASGQYLVEGVLGTQVTASGTGVEQRGANEVVVSQGQTVTGVQVTLGSGDNRFVMRNVHDTGTFSVTAGDGNDRVTLAGSKIDGDTTATLGNGEDRLRLVGDTYAGNFTATLGGAASTAADWVMTNASKFSQAFSLTTGGGNDTVRMFGLTDVTGAATIDLGAGDDIVQLGVSEYAGDLSIDGGTGTNSGYGLPLVSGTYTPTNLTNDHIHTRS
jgi:hypothetical protein